MKITTIGPVNHDGEDIEIGTTLNLPARQARDLINAQAAEPAGKSAQQEEGGEGTPDGNDGGAQ